ncbi:uncharacterized protein CEXT_678531 [Caerostris extrusa]|uniref:Uncharacterized protein n=1 Tax=Caerostris extrusa TaxID=172846 RepID=A0AAV4UX30_CAEEX|nr:uncharacterized protein CEXT_678531 [Caerostris extrusa]
MIKIWDSLMQESEKKELWSSPIDDSNVPSSGWIPLFRVIKTQNSNFRNNSTKPEETIVESSRPQSSQTDSSTTPESSPLKEEWNIPHYGIPKNLCFKTGKRQRNRKPKSKQFMDFHQTYSQGREAWILVKGSEGNRTRESNEPQRSEKSRIDGSNSKHQTSYTPTKEFSFDLKNWEKDSDWTPLLRAVGSVTSKGLIFRLTKVQVMAK